MGSGVLRKKLYDQNLSDWSARYRKNKQNLENLERECQVLRVEVSKNQQEVDERVQNFEQLETNFNNTVFPRVEDLRSALEAATQQRAVLQSQLSESRKHKTQLTREKKFLSADYERKHAELMRVAEMRDKPDMPLTQA